RRVDELFEARERHDRVHLRLHLRARAAEERAVEVNVLAAGELRFESGAELQQRHDAAAPDGDSIRWRDDCGRDAEQRRLAGAVRADDADRLAASDRERYVAQA